MFSQFQYCSDNNMLSLAHFSTCIFHRLSSEGNKITKDRKREITVIEEILEMRREIRVDLQIIYCLK